MKLQSLQILRALAAWLVVYHHFMQVFYNFNYNSFLGEFFSYRGGFGVDVFFVLSGFVMYSSINSNSNTSPVIFFVKRLFRIFPAYWFYTFSFVFLILLIPSGLSERVFTLESLVLSLFFIPHQNPTGLGVYPLLTVGWTLNFEMMFYLILSVCLFWGNNKALFLCCIIIFFLPLVIPSQVDVIFYVLNSIKLWQFIFGIFVGLFISKYTNIPFFNYRTGFFFIVLAFFVISSFFGYGFVQKTLSATFLVLGFILIEPILDKKNFVVRFLVKLGDISYSTYLSHVLILHVFVYMFGNDLTGLGELSVLVLMSCSVYFVSILTYNYVENSSYVDFLRNKVIRLKFNNL
ncbi:acyltransferase family protein [Vibrio ostreae]|uniref:Acyltransferase n=1 Tax=Vibrio ostreae TaxID=2841925 RepID=A0A975YN79_9VIBR|nr:acyltransferase [Vibrio ostreae]QXO17236.1 acyltransferase [Vibrio ostreae]